MIEQLLSIGGAIVVFLAVVLRLNVLKAERHTITFWRILEVLGLVGLLGGSVGVAGEWFLESAEFHAETIFMVGAAMFAIGISRGALCQVVARLQGWDGTDRRQAPRGRT
jgi:hypothetical protein